MAAVEICYSSVSTASHPLMNQLMQLWHHHLKLRYQTHQYPVPMNSHEFSVITTVIAVITLIFATSSLKLS